MYSYYRFQESISCQSHDFDNVASVKNLIVPIWLEIRLVSATRYGLGGPRIDSQSGTRVSAPVQTGPGAHQASYTMGTGSFPGGKLAGAWSWPPPPSSAEAEGRVELYMYSPSGPSWPVLGWTIPLPLPLDLFQSRYEGFGEKNLCLCRESNSDYSVFQSIE